MDPDPLVSGEDPDPDPLQKSRISNTVYKDFLVR
jgi:hypothetical protein